MTTQAQLDYSVFLVGQASSAAIAAAMQSVPLPQQLLDLIGAGIVLSDTTAILPGPPRARRRVILSIVPTSNATAVATLRAGEAGTGAPVVSVGVTFPGTGYTTPPVIEFSPAPSDGQSAQAFAELLVNSVGVTSGGAGYSPTPNVALVGGFRGATVPPYCVQSVSIDKPGNSYSPGTTLVFRGYFVPNDPNAREAQGFPVLNPDGSIGGVVITDMGEGYLTPPTISLIDPMGTGQNALLDPNMVTGSPAKLSVTVLAGVITAILVTIPGSTNYVSVPDVVITDPTGTGATATADMGVGQIIVTDGGVGYPSVIGPPTVNIVPAFKKTWPDGSNQSQPFFHLISAGIQQAVPSPVVSAAPVIT